MNRRDLIKAFAAVAPLTVAGRVWAAPATDARLLVVFLRGAYDAANVVVPISSDFYYHSRPTLGIAKPDVGNPNSALSLNAEWGLHPALRDSIFPLWGKREIAFVPFAGTSDDLTELDRILRLEMAARQIIRRAGERHEGDLAPGP